MTTASSLDPARKAVVQSDSFYESFEMANDGDPLLLMAGLLFSRLIPAFLTFFLQGQGTVTMLPAGNFDFESGSS